VERRVARIPNPLRWLLLAVGSLLAKLGLIDARRVERTTDLAWPRIVTGIARMSKNAADVAMVGLALGPAAIAGVGFATAFWGVAFAIGGGVAVLQDLTQQRAPYVPYAQLNNGNFTFHPHNLLSAYIQKAPTPLGRRGTYVVPPKFASRRPPAAHSYGDNGPTRDSILSVCSDLWSPLPSGLPIPLAKEALSQWPPLSSALPDGTHPGQRFES